MKTNNSNALMTMPVLSVVLLLVSCSPLRQSTPEGFELHGLTTGFVGQEKELDDEFIAAANAKAQSLLPPSGQSVDRQQEQILQKETGPPTSIEQESEHLPLTEADENENPADIMEQEVNTEPAQYSVNSEFKLSEHEQELYNSYLNSLDISVLAGEEPITVGKIFIRLALNEQLEACYGLHAKTDSLIPKEQYIPKGKEILSMMDETTRKSFADKEFGDIDQKEFIQTTETTGYAEYEDHFGFTHKINFIKNGDNVWQIEFFNF